MRTVAKGSDDVAVLTVVLFPGQSNVNEETYWKCRQSRETQSSTLEIGDVQPHLTEATKGDRNRNRREFR